MTKGEQTRQAIIERAAPLFNQRGFAGCSIADILEATGLEKGGLYRHFASKEELATEVFRYAARMAVEARALDSATPGDAPTRLRLTVSRFVEIPSPLPGGCPLLNTAVDSDDGNPVLRQLAAEAFAAWKQRIRQMVKSGIAEGSISASADPDALANVIVSTLEGALMITRLEDNRRALRDAQGFLNTLIDSVTAKPPGRPRSRTKRAVKPRSS